MTGGAQEISAPEHLTAAHDVSGFDSGVPDLDGWLRKRALANEETGASRTYVVCAGGRVVGYYALATGGVAQVQAPGRVRRNMPDPVPVVSSILDSHKGWVTPIHFPDRAFLASATVIIKIMGSTGETRNPCRP